MNRTLDFSAPGVIPFTKDQLSEMCLMYLGGATIDQVAEKYGISASAVNVRLSTMGVRLRRRGPVTTVTQEVVVSIWEMRSEKVPWADIAKKLGFNERYLQQIYRRSQSDGKNSLSLYSLPSQKEAKAAS